MLVKFKKLNPTARLPEYAHESGDAGMDLFSCEDVVLRADVPRAVSCGFAMEIPDGYEAQIRSRSGLALRNGIVVLNAPGTIDPSYRGEVKVILCWNGLMANNGEFGEFGMEYPIAAGSRIAQMVFAQFCTVKAEVVDDLSETIRGDGGFGSTGV